jgi:hypothetical protein
MPPFRKSTHLWDGTEGDSLMPAVGRWTLQGVQLGAPTQNSGMNYWSVKADGEAAASKLGQAELQVGVRIGATISTRNYLSARPA